MSYWYHHLRNSQNRQPGNREGKIKGWKLKDEVKQEECREIVKKKIPTNEVGTAEYEWEHSRVSFIDASLEVCGRCIKKRRDNMME